MFKKQIGLKKIVHFSMYFSNVTFLSAFKGKKGKCLSYDGGRCIFIICNAQFYLGGYLNTVINLLFVLVVSSRVCNWLIIKRTGHLEMLCSWIFSLSEHNNRTKLHSQWRKNWRKSIFKCPVRFVKWTVCPVMVDALYSRRLTNWQNVFSSFPPKLGKLSGWNFNMLLRDTDTCNVQVEPLIISKVIANYNIGNKEFAKSF